MWATRLGDHKNLQILPSNIKVRKSVKTERLVASDEESPGKPCPSKAFVEFLQGMCMEERHPVTDDMLGQGDTCR